MANGVYIEQAEQAVRDLAARHGWECATAAIATSGASVYLTLKKEADIDADHWAEQAYSVRVSDHAQSDLRDPTDFTISADGSGHTLAQIEVALAVSSEQEFIARGWTMRGPRFS